MKTTLDLPNELVREKKLPLFKCAKNAPARRMSVEQLLALQLAAQTQEDLERLGPPL